MAATDDIAIVQARRPDDASAGLLLSTEAHWNQNEDDWRFFLGKGPCSAARRRRPAGRHRGAAALRGGQRLDQHGAGDRKLARAAVLRPGWSMHCLDDGSRQRPRPGSTPRRPARRSTVRWDSRRRCELRRLRLESRHPKRSASLHRRSRAASTDAHRARSRRVGFDRSTLLTEFAATRAGSRLCRRGEAVALVARRPHRAPDRSAVRRRRGWRACPGRRDRSSG